MPWKNIWMSICRWSKEKREMVKKVMKWILIGIAALIGLVIVGVTLLVAISNYKGANYWKFAEPQGMIETKYTSMGEHEVLLAEFDAPDTVWEKYEIWYPSNLEQSDQAYPVVVIANGTGMKASKQSAIYEHLASWGFIVAGNEDEHSRTGASSAATLDFILSLNEDPQSVFYGRIDTENIGIVGHSQGGVGAINAVTQQKNGNLYKTICAQSTTSSAVAYALNQLDGELGGGWNCDTSTLSIPAFMVAGTGSADAGNVEENRLELAEGETQGICPLWWLRECFDAMPDTVPKIIGRLSGKDHGDIPFSADGYMTAWFMYWLQGDEAAGKAFFGADAEIGANENWQDVTINFP